MMWQDVALNGTSIRDNDPRIIIVSITENTPKESSNVTPRGYGHGSFRARSFRQEMSVTVVIYINEPSLSERDEIYSTVRKWGRFAGYLTTTMRENQRLYVEEMDVKTSGKKRAEYIALTFTAYSRPFWENVAYKTATISTAAYEGETTLHAPGNTDECTVDAEITAIGGTLNTLTVTAGETSMSFAALGISENSKLTISHTDAGLLIIKNGETSLMANRTAMSSDDLIANPGVINTVGFSANVTCTAKFITRGGWQ